MSLSNTDDDDVDDDDDHNEEEEAELVLSKVVYEFFVTGSGSIAPIVFDIHVHHFCKKSCDCHLASRLWPHCVNAVDGSEIPNNHLLDVYSKPCRKWVNLPTSTGGT